MTGIIGEDIKRWLFICICEETGFRLIGRMEDTCLQGGVEGDVQMYTPSCLVQIEEGFLNQAERFVSFSKGFLVSKTCCEMFVENCA